MKSKILIFVNTLLVLLYAYVNSFSEIEGFNAILLIIVFGLAMASQLIFATILKPEKINILFVTIVLLRLAVFLTIPLQKNIYLYAISVIVTFCLDLWQYLHWKTNSIFKTKTYTQDELVYSKKSIEIVFVFSLIIAALLCHNEGLAIVFLVISLYKLFKITLTFASRLHSITILIPAWFDSSRKSVIPSTILSLCNSAIRSISLRLFT